MSKKEYLLITEATQCKYSRRFETFDELLEHLKFWNMLDGWKNQYGIDVSEMSPIQLDHRITEDDLRGVYQSHTLKKVKKS